MRSTQTKLTLCLLLMLAQVSTACTSPLRDASSDAVTASTQGQVSFFTEHIHGLSGIAYRGGDNYLVVSDTDGTMAHATIKLAPETGEIQQAKISEQVITLIGRRDVEAISIDPLDCMLIVADESTGLHHHHFPSGRHVKPFAMSSVFKRARPNLGFEAVSAIDPRLGHATVWSANEEALAVDGPRATATQGTLVRLQRFGQAREPDGQFAYRTDPHRGADNVLKRAQSGVSGIVTLDRHRLIVMERELGGSFIPAFRIRLYLVDTKNAMDTAAVDSLIDKRVVPVAKALLFEIDAKLSNFEGITLGPQLNNGDYTLLLVSDDGGGKTNPQNLMSLRVPAHIVEGKANTAANIQPAR